MINITWKEEIVEVLKELGGEGSYKDIYQRIRDRGRKPLNVNWKASVRKVIEDHSSDSKNFIGREDLFYSVYGIGKGYWGLRDFDKDEKLGNMTEDDLSFPEGKKVLKTHIKRERNPRIIKEAKKLFKQKHGKLFCEVCGFDFEKMYGQIGKDFIEGHHSIPVSMLNENSKTKVKDIVLVCSNCHKMLHRKRPWLNRNELKNLINNNKNYENI